MTSRSHWLPLLAGLLIVAVLGGGGIYVMSIFAGGGPPAGQATVVVVIPAVHTTQSGNTAIPPAPTQPANVNAEASSNYILVTIAPTLESTATPIATDTPVPSLTFPASATVTTTYTPSLTPTITTTPSFINGVASSDYLPVVSQRAREIYQYGLRVGNNPNVFSRLGDCHSSTPGFLGAFDTPNKYQLGSYTNLQDVIAYYAGSFSHPNQTAYSGLHMGSFFAPLWANPDFCKGAENVMDCEYRLDRPSVIFISVGTLNMQSPAEEFERFVRPIVEFWINKGVVPILNTKADDIEGDDRFNTVIRKLAREYDLPLWDFATVARTLPNNGLQSDNVHLDDGEPYFDEPTQMLTGWTIRNLTGLQALEAVWQGLQ
jgi:hypothetical protein